ncbi:hypothetical protein QUA43_28730 [Microcoleus sp. N9_B4]
MASRLLKKLATLPALSDRSIAGAGFCSAAGGGFSLSFASSASVRSRSAWSCARSRVTSSNCSSSFHSLSLPLAMIKA